MVRGPTQSYEPLMERRGVGWFRAALGVRECRWTRLDGGSFLCLWPLSPSVILAGAPSNWPEVQEGPYSAPYIDAKCCHFTRKGKGGDMKR